MLKTLQCTLTTVCFLFSSFLLAADEITIPIYRTTAGNEGEYIGDVYAKQTEHGVRLRPDLHGLTPGMHGFHIHQNPSCLNHGMAAGEHLDPDNSRKHLGPYECGHLGDLPALQVDYKGKATISVVAPRLKLEDLKKHTLMIHQGGDNYSDFPKPLGGGGDRIACGIINW